MSTLTIRLPDDTAQRLKSLAQSRGLSMNKLVEQLSAHALSAWDTEIVFPIEVFVHKRVEIFYSLVHMYKYNKKSPIVSGGS